jgi:hypothetical protein
MSQIKEAFFRYSVNTKSTLQYPFDFCSDVAFIGTTFSRNCYLLFVLSFLISDLTFVFLLLSLLVSVQPDFSKIFFLCHGWKKNFKQKCTSNYETCLENQLNNFWTWNNCVLMKYHTGDSAEWIIIIWAQFGGQVLGTPRTLCSVSLHSLMISESGAENGLLWLVRRLHINRPEGMYETILSPSFTKRCALLLLIVCFV